MRRYDDPVEVRRGLVTGLANGLATGLGAGSGAGDEGPGVEGVEGPEQFLWRGRLWKVCAVVAHWVETGPWWQSSGVRAVLGADDAPDVAGAPGVAGGAGVAGLLAEREVWRVEAARGSAGLGHGVFDLVFDWAEGSWRLARCVD
jgi:hypothetical protein